MARNINNVKDDKMTVITNDIERLKNRPSMYIGYLGEAGVLRTAVIFFYLSNEGVSLLENASRLGLPIPEKLKEILQQLHDKGGNDHEST